MTVGSVIEPETVWQTTAGTGTVLSGTFHLKLKHITAIRVNSLVYSQHAIPRMQ